MGIAFVWGPSLPSSHNVHFIVRCGSFVGDMCALVCWHGRGATRADAGSVTGQDGTLHQQGRPFRMAGVVVNGCSRQVGG